MIQSQSLVANPSRLLQVLDGRTPDRPPVWFMRQAGRYLSEYRALRAEAPDFIAFCLNPEMAAEATMQPMRRFGFDAAIVFADILLIPRALGQDVWFETGEGPRLGEMPSVGRMKELADGAGDYLHQVGQTLSLVRAALEPEPERALIGFAGAPWTVATYMLDGHHNTIGKGERATARSYAYAEPDKVDGTLDVLVEATARYLKMQADAGAQVLKIFESWAEGLPDDLFDRLVLRPHQALVARVRELGVTVPLIGFPRGSAAHAERYAAEVDVQAVALDTACPLEVGKRVQAIKPIQGNLDPLLLRVGGAALDRRVDQLVEAWGQGPWIFNLGHGILPDVPVAHVEQVLKRIGAQ
jgi:uroporphyrinogen decarboxylase